MHISERFKGAILCGAIGDAYGRAYENISVSTEREDVYYLFGKPKEPVPQWHITDDTQLTLATCEAIISGNNLSTEVFAKAYLSYFQERRISGIGASTLQALKELEAGVHWSLVGRKGEYAAGNGAAMRIAPLAFLRPAISRKQIKEICNITHHNDEAYVGALAVIISIQATLEGTWTGNENLIGLVIDQIPDTKVRDRLIEIKDFQNIEDVGKLGCDGYVVNSVPLAIAAANKAPEIGLEKMFNQLIDLGGDTDTNASIAGQIAGTLFGSTAIPEDLLSKLKTLYEFRWIKNTVDKFIEVQKWNAIV